MKSDIAVRAASLLSYTGIAGIACAWAIIGTSVALNPWFVLTRNAFSDLGADSATDPWLFNYGMIGIGALICVYSWTLAFRARNRTQVAGGTLFLTAGFFLMLIGYFHEGTYPHLFISYWFFVQSALAIIAWGLGLLLSGERKEGSAVLMLGLISPLAAAVIPWPSAAMAEGFGIVVINVWVAICTFFEAGNKIDSPVRI